MRGRAGFTILELLVAITLAGVVAVLVYGAAGAGIETGRRLEESRRVLQRARAMRVTLEDALRNARPALRLGDTAFVLEDLQDMSGRPVDRLSFITAGGLPPLAAEGDWFVILAPTPEGLRLSAAPAGVRDATPVVALLPGVTGLEVRVQGLGAAAPWSGRWSFRSVVPRAVELTYWDDGGPLGLPLLVALPLGGAP